MTRPKRTEGRRQLTLNLADQVHERLERLRIQTEADSTTEVVRRALIVYEVVLACADQHTISILRPDNSIEKLILP